ncbi:DUF748 domain-containing protein [Dasania marina]|uniref:DUF748 domain-containing protein n=1 Tax=Dasania marina TaxID=471499 RepID=UPI0030DA5ACF|tara:strand:+ start:22553 stop:24892 length:2340 start_codon:yes stop_codon:yes gene_type:complete
MTLSAALRSKLVKFTAAFIILLALLPEVLRFALIQASPRMGLGELSLADINLNLFNGQLEFEQLVLKQQGEPVLDVAGLRVDVTWWRSLNDEPTVENIDIDGLQLPIEQNASGQWQLLMALPSSNPDEQPADKTTDGFLPAFTLNQFTLSNSRLLIRSPALNGELQIAQLQLQHFSTVQQQPLQLQLEANWNKATITLALQGQLLEQQQNLAGTLNVQQFQASDFAPLLGQDIAALSQLQLTFNGKRNQQGAISGALNGSLNLEQMRAAYKTLALNAEQLQWQGSATFSQQGETLRYSASNQLSLTALQLDNNKTQQRLVQLQHLQLDDLHVDETLAISGKTLSLEQLVLLPKPDKEPAKLTNGLLKLADFNYSPAQGLAIKQIVINDTQYYALITNKGELAINAFSEELMAELADSSAEQTTTTPQPKNSNDQPTPFVFAIEQLTLTGDSFLLFEDQRFQPSVKQKLYIKNLAVEHVTNRSSSEKMLVELQAAMGEFSHITINGQLTPFAQPLGLHLKGTIEAVDLTDISPYAESYLGYYFSKGQLDHKFDITLADNNVQATNKVNIRQLELRAAKKQSTPGIERKLNIPLDMALNVLRDSNNNIELNIPIKGPVDKLGVGLSDIINNALSNSLMSGATHYLKYALQPYGGILMAAEYLGDKATSISLQPVVFEPGSAQLPDTMQDYSQKIVGLMQQRPQLSLSLCGSANASDKTALAAGSDSKDESNIAEAQLIQLAEQRSRAVKSIFIAQGIASKRLYVCQAGFKAKGKNAVLLSL